MLKSLEERVKLLESKIEKPTETAPKKKRKKSEYNVYVQEFIAKEKKKGTKLTHQELFKEAANSWSKNK